MKQIKKSKNQNIKKSNQLNKKLKNFKKNKQIK
jgi:hypothetical protein